MKENALILFLKLPSKGKVKTRLEKDLGPDLVLVLYNAFISDILNICSQVDADTLIVYSPDGESEEMNKSLLESSRSFEQRGNGLGERMFNAFSDSYSYGYRRCVLIGSDIPGITSYTLSEAFNKLAEFDVVLGPSSDGGYYLIGNNLRSNSELYYKDIEWSRSDVYKKTEDKVVSLRYTMFKLETLNDIDDLSDLIKYYETNRSNLLSESIKIISQNRDLIIKK